MPPRGLYIPVLPVKINGKLVFTLCHTCALENNSEVCQHNDFDRCISGTWIILEIQEAIKYGYQVVVIEEIWHYEKTTNDLNEGVPLQNTYTNL